MLSTTVSDEVRVMWTFKIDQFKNKVAPNKYPNNTITLL